MKKLLVIISIVVAALNVSGQQKEIDSLEQYYHYSSDEKRMEICLQLSNSYRNINPSRGLEYAYEGLYVARQLNHPKTEGEILNEIGVLFRKLGDLNKAIIYHKEALEVFRKIDYEMGIAYCFSNIASVNYALGYYEMALEYANLSLEIKEKLDDENQIAYTTRIIATIYHESGRYDEALPYYERSMKYYAKLNNKLEEANIMLNIAIISTSLNDNSDMDYIDSLYSSSQKMYELEGSKYGIAVVKYYRGGWEMENERFNMAEQHLLHALALSEEIEAKLLYIKIIGKLSAYYGTTGEVEKAYQYLKEYTSLQEAIFSEKNARDLADMEVRILLEEQDKAITGLQEDRNTRNAIILLILIILVISLFSLFAFLKRYREIKSLNSQLNHEIQQRKLSQEKLQRSEEQLKENIADKNRFFSIVAHDLRSPFSGMYGLIYLLNEQYDDIEEDNFKEILNKLQSTSEHINALLEDILSWANISSGKLNFKPTLFSLDEVVKEVLELNALRMQSKEVSCSIVGIEKQVFADRNMVKTIFMNLISNAIKFSERGGEIEIYCEETDDGPMIFVKDNGIGMDENQIQTLMQPGINPSLPGTDGEKGSGLGLLLVHELLEKHDSKLDVVSSPGQGTTMSFPFKKA